MKWIVFTGTWRLINNEVELDVRKAAREVIERGDGIITGGATGVDYFAMEEALKLDPTASHIRVIIPAQLEEYLTDYYTNWLQEPITKSDIDKIAVLLRRLKQINPSSLLEMPYKVIEQKHYDLRSEQEIMYGNEVYAFQVNDSTGTQHTMDYAIRAGVLVTLHKKYNI